MPVPIPGLKVGSDNQKVKFLTIFGRPKTAIFRRFRSVPGGPNPLDMDTLAARTLCSLGSRGLGWGSDAFILNLRPNLIGHEGVYPVGFPRRLSAVVTGSLTNWVIGKPRKNHEISGFDPNSKPQKLIILAIRIDF